MSYTYWLCSEVSSFKIKTDIARQAVQKQIYGTQANNIISCPVTAYSPGGHQIWEACFYCNYSTNGIPCELVCHSWCLVINLLTCVLHDEKIISIVKKCGKREKKQILQNCIKGIKRVPIKLWGHKSGKLSIHPVPLEGTCTDTDIANYICKLHPPGNISQQFC